MSSIMCLWKYKNYLQDKKEGALERSPRFNSRQSRLHSATQLGERAYIVTYGNRCCCLVGRITIAKKQYNPKWNKTEWRNGWIRGLDGRPIHIDSEHKILVFMLQSDEAIMMAAAYVLANKRLRAKYTYKEQFGFVCWYHDEYTIECDVDIAEDVAAIAEQCIVDAGKFYNINCPHEGEAAIGRDWYSIH